MRFSESRVMRRERKSITSEREEIWGRLSGRLRSGLVQALEDLSRREWERQRVESGSETEERQGRPVGVMLEQRGRDSISDAESECAGMTLSLVEIFVG